MAKDPAFLFYTGDFTTGTQFFSDEQVGKYVRLLMAQHQHGHLSEKQMIQICKSHDADIWSKFSKDQEGLFFQQRLEFEIEKRRSYTESRSKNKKGKTKSHDIHIKNKSRSYGKRMENENENKDIIENRIENENEKGKLELVFPFTSPAFMQVWEVLLKEKKWKGKSYAALQASLEKLSEQSEDVAIQMIKDSIAGGWQGLFEPKNTHNGTTKSAEQKSRILDAQIEAIIGKRQ